MKKNYDRKAANLSEALGNFEISSKRVDPGRVLDTIGAGDRNVREGVESSMVRVLSGDEETTKNTDFLFVERNLDLAELMQLGFSESEAEKMQDVPFLFLVTNYIDALEDNVERDPVEQEKVKDTIVSLLSYGDQLNDTLGKTRDTVMHAAHSEESDTDGSEINVRVIDVVSKMIEMREGSEVVILLGHGGPLDPDANPADRDKVLGAHHAGRGDITANDAMKTLAALGKLDNNVVIDISCTGGADERAAPTLTQELIDPKSRQTFDLFLPVTVTMNRRVVTPQSAYWIHSDQERFSISVF